ncbi:probable peptidylprolyl isomerase (FK506-binding protein homolog) [Fusarium torulosum]|uniref:peptidylprolyl isomerase n=1 Tax=Fusarium torulosum TaxID=33205 RepID=A0AAE8M3E3_9HYPO|nr:probable peptidylprolyl isomerase (FK506-binding protein homolog) [Fusarium torulosum]
MRPFSLASIPRATRITTRINPFFTQPRNFSFTQATMAVEKYTITEGSGPSPEKGQTVTMEYTGWLKDTSKPENKGKQYVLSTTPSYRSYLTFSPSRFDSSVGRGDFVVKIGVGQVIKGWDEGVTQMKLNEKATLDITADYGYGARGFPGAIPPNSDLIFDVQLKKIS